MANDTTSTLRSVRGVPDPLWRELVVEAAVQNRPIGALLSEAIHDALRVWHGDATLQATEGDEGEEVEEA